MIDKIPRLERDFRNKIVGHGVVEIDQLLANPYNWRVHPSNQQEALAGSIDEVGYIRSILLNKTTGHIIDGHLRVTLAARSGVKELPVEYVELSEEEEAMALAVIDPIAALAMTDKQKLNELLTQIQTDNTAIQQLLGDLAGKEGMYEDKMNFDEFKSADEKDILYRVIVDGLTRSEADELSATVENSRVEQYRL